MTIRFSLLQSFSQGTRSMLTAQTKVFETQEQIATGRKVLTPADDPVASARILTIGQDQSQIQQFLNNAGAVENRLAIEETQLEAVTNMLHRVRELTIQAGGPYSFSDRQILAAEVRGRLSELMDLSNTKDTNGEYIFAGFQGGEQPFTLDAQGEVMYNGDDGQRFVSIASSTTVAISDSGESVFVDIPAAAAIPDTRTDSGNTGTGAVASSVVVQELDSYRPDVPANYRINFTGSATYDVIDQNANPNVAVVTGAAFVAGVPISIDPSEPGRLQVTITGAPAAGDNFFIESPPKQSIMATLKNLADGLDTFNDSDAGRLQLQFMLQETLSNIGHAEENIGKINAQLGARFNTVESVQLMHEGVQLVNSKVLSDIRDLDYAEAVSRLSMQTFTLEAAQQSFAKVSGLSLFKFLR